MENRFIAAAIAAAMIISGAAPALAAGTDKETSAEIISPAPAADAQGMTPASDGAAQPLTYEGEEPLLTAQQQERLLRYEEYLKSTQDKDEGEVRLAADTVPTFNQYLADYNYNFNCYNFYKNEFTSPYRSFAETKMNSPVYQTLLAGWRITTFELSDITSYSRKEVGFYEAILFDVLYQGVDLESLSGMAKDKMDTIQASSLKKVSDFLGQDVSTLIMTDLDALSSEEFEALTEAFDACEELEDIFGAIGDWTKVLGYVNTVEEFIYKLAKAQVIAENANETARILLRMKSNTDNEALKAALDNMILVCEENASETTALEVFGSDLAIGELVKWSLDKSWDLVLDTLGLYGIAVSAGQAAGKTLVNWLFSTEEDVELYYTLCALYEFEDTLKETLSSYESSYLSSGSNSASVTFNEAYKMLLNTHLFGMKVSKQYMDMLYKHGVINELLFSFREEEYNGYAESMDSITRSIEGTISGMTVIAYDAYLRDYCPTTAPVLNITPKLETEEEKTELEQYIHEEISLQRTLSYSMNNLHIDEDMTLEDDIQTYGSVYMDGGTLDLNGHTLEVDGEFLQSGGTVKINNGRLIIHSDYRMQERVIDSTDNSVSYDDVFAGLVMEKDSDYLEVGGGFYFQSRSVETLTKGTVKLNGDFTVTGGNDCSLTSSGDCKFIIAGNIPQRFTFDNRATLSQLEYTGTSTVTVSGELAIGTLNSDVPLTSEGLMLTGIDNGNRYKLTVTGDMILDGDVDLNGGGLEVSGELMQTGGDLEINNGSVVVGGDYRMQERVIDESDGSVSYDDVFAGLVMEKDGDYLEVGGGFYFQSRSTETLTKGTVKLCGDFTVTGGNDCSLTSSGDCKFIIAGNAPQRFTFDNRATLSQLEYAGTSTVTVSGELAIGTLNSNVPLTSEGLMLMGIDNGNRYKLSVTGDMILDGDVDLNGGGLEVSGELMQTGGDLEINNGSVVVGGDYRMQERVIDESDGSVSYDDVFAGLVMEKDGDYLEVGGGFYFQSRSTETLTKGTVKLCGDFTVTGGNDCSLTSSGDCKFIIAGNAQQRFTFDNRATLSQLEYTGTSTVTVSGELAIGTLNSDVPLTSEGLILMGIDNGNRYKLTVTGDMILDGDVDLNGGGLEVSGELMQTGGNLEINNGSVVVGGDYRMQERVVDESDGSVSYDDVFAGLVMEKDGDYLEVGGDFYGQSRSSSVVLENGVFVLRGDYNELRSGYFDTSGNHVLVFDGSGRQDVSTVTSSIDFANLVITNVRGPVIFNNETNINGVLRQPGGAAIGSPTNVFFDDEPIFADRGGENTAVNSHVGNAEGVIPTVWDGENYDNGISVRGESYIGAKTIMRSADGRRILAPAVGEAFSVEARLVRAAQTEGTEQLIAAVYDTEGGLLGTYSAQFGDESLPVCTISVPAQDSSIGIIKLFLWDGLDNMQPLMDCENVFGAN